MPLITYKFADGHSEEIEVSDEVAAAFAQLEKYEKKVERKETRRHVSLNLLMENGFDFSADDTDFLDVLDKEEQEKSEWREEQFCRRVLGDKKMEIFSLLTFRQADAYFRHKYLHIQKTEIARYLNVTEGAVRKLIKKAEANLQKYRLANEKEVKTVGSNFRLCFIGGTIFCAPYGYIMRGLFSKLNRDRKVSPLSG